MVQTRCPYCGRYFEPIPGKGGRQKTCGELECHARHRRLIDRQWYLDNPDSRRLRDEKVRDRRREEGYWKAYVAGHPEYARCNREQTRERMRALRARRKEEAAILKDPVEYLEGIGPDAAMFATQDLAELRLRGSEASRPSMFATQELVAELSLGMWKYLKARERFATQEGQT